MKPNGGNDGIGTLFRCKPGRHFRFVRCDASFHIIVDVAFYENGKVLSRLLLHIPNDFAQEVRPSDHVPSIPICPFVGVARQKLSNEVSVSSMDFNTIKSSLPCPSPGIAKFQDHGLNLFQSHFPRNFDLLGDGPISRNQIGGTDGLEPSDLRGTFSPSVENLKGDLSPNAMDRIRKAPVSKDELIVIGTQTIDDSLPLQGDMGTLRHI